MVPAGSMVKMNYTGYLLDGTKFDSNEDTAFKHVTPFEFKLGAGNVIKGWDEGVAKMKKGEKGTLYIPSWMAYGANARPGGDANPKGIPANSCLIFDVELLDYSIPVDEESVLREYFAARQLTPTRTATGLYYNIEKEGTGELCKAGDKISMQYTGQLLDGTKFDSNVDTAFGHVQPFEFNLGQGQVIKGWDEGIALLKKGSKAKLYIPSEMAYGKTPFPGSPANPKGIPPGSILIFDVEVMDIKKP
jgi:FKBP-type peptidyl-prolyl cis-trans isomerase